MTIAAAVYRLGASLLPPLVPWVLREEAQRRAHAARVAAPTALIDWGQQRDPARFVAWFHAASVGEGLQTAAVIEVFRRRHPDALIIYTHYSPSAEGFARQIGTDWAGYLPYDRRVTMAQVLDAVRPDLLVFGKVDLWPELATQAVARGIPTALIAGTVERESSRLRWPTRALIHHGYAALTGVGAISEGDAVRLAALGTARDRITITGDPRIDASLRRAGTQVTAWRRDDLPPPLIAGSTWRSDEEHLLDAMARLRSEFPSARLVLVPHQPTPAALAAIRSYAARKNLPTPVLLSHHSAEDPCPPLLIVDQVGLLAGLYHAGAAALIGGGFGTRGIHSVLEPAAAGLAVTIGPQDRGSRDAALLAAVGALHRLPATGTVSALTNWWRTVLTDPDGTQAAGAAGRERLCAEDGAAERSVDLLEQVARLRE